MIELKSITKTYGAKNGKTATRFTALKDVNLKIETGESVAIVGKSGSGKSTMMHVMSGLDTPTRGTVVIDGNDIFKWSQSKIDDFRAREMSFIFQSFFVEGNETCYQNVSLPLEISNVSLSKRQSKIHSALKTVGLLDKKESLAKDLSGGQKQRLAIARAIAVAPKILFADEPTGNLDSQTGADIIKTLFSYNKSNKTTLIIVTHDPELAALCDRQVHVKDGIIEKVTKKGGKNA